MRRHVSVAVWLLVAATALLPACGGGGGGGGGGGTLGVGPGPGGGGGPVLPPPNDPADFFLQGAFFARPIFDENGALASVVNPSSLHETDPITGIAVPGFPKPLVPGMDLAELATINLDQIQDPLTPQIPLVPRNAAIVLDFSKSVAAGSLNLGAADAGETDLLKISSTIQVRGKNGVVLPARASVIDDFVVIHSLSTSSVGFDASPVVFDKFGSAVEDPTGFHRIVMGAGVGLGVLTATSGETLVPRTDGLATLPEPLPFNPGNSFLDAIVLQTDAGVMKFNGFLPDRTPPRIIRPVELNSTVDDTTIDSVFFGDPPTITGRALAIAANTTANVDPDTGLPLGEWANALLEVTGLGGKVTRYAVEKNTNVAGTQPVFHLQAGTIVDVSVAPGTTYRVLRSEFFEPIPPPLPIEPADLAHITVDPVAHPRDPFDPQDQFNHDLRFFVRMFDHTDENNVVEATDRWDPAANLFSGLPGKFLSVPHKVSLRVQFNEFVDPASFRPYENFFVTDLAVGKNETGFTRQRIGRIVPSDDKRSISFEPFLEDQVDPSRSEFIGFGGTPKSLKLVIRTIPEDQDIAAVKANVSPSQLAKLFDLDSTGVLGVTDLGGRGLGMPAALLDQGDAANFFLQSTSVGRGPFPPAIDFQVAFQTQAAPLATDPNYKAIVHRFMGQANSAVHLYTSGSVHDEVTSGVEYVDFPAEDNDNNGIIENETTDRRFIYGPEVFDIGLNIPGHLTGSAAASIEHVIDSFNAPKNSPFASPNNEDFLAKLGFGSRLPLDSAWGVRFQHVFRAGDASPAFNDFEGIILDLVGLAWSPVLGFVTNSTITDMEILVGLSGTNKGKGPNTKQANGIPDDENSGLIQQFDCNLLEYHDICCISNDVIGPALAPFVAQQPPLTSVVKTGTPYVMSPTNLIRPANATGLPTSQFNFFLPYPKFNAGLDQAFAKEDVFSFPYDSRFPMLVEYRTRPSPSGNFPSTNNFYNFSPGVGTSVLPRFRVWSQGQDPLAYCVPNIALAASGQCNFYGGEGGPLLEPGTLISDVHPPANNNGMPIILASAAYQKPGKVGCLAGEQVEPDQIQGDLQGGVLPTCNSDPAMNWYWANGFLMLPLPSLSQFPGPTGLPPTTYYGYGPFGTNNGPIPLGIEPGYTCNPQRFGDNSRYWMMFQYQKRVSVIESPTITAPTSTGNLEYRTPIIIPPLASVDPAAGLKVEFRAGTQLDFFLPALESGYLPPDLVIDDGTGKNLAGVGQDRVYNKFRATYGIAKGKTQPPVLDTVVIPIKEVQ